MTGSARGREQRVEGGPTEERRSQCRKGRQGQRAVDKTFVCCKKNNCNTLVSRKKEKETYTLGRDSSKGFSGVAEKVKSGRGFLALVRSVSSLLFGLRKSLGWAGGGGVGNNSSFVLRPLKFKKCNLSAICFFWLMPFDNSLEQENQ